MILTKIKVDSFKDLRSWLSSNKLLLIILGIFLAITLYLSYRLNIWEDEYYSLTTTSKGIGYAISQALSFENQPPLYFALLNIWRLFGSSPFIARLFSILCILLTILVTLKITEKVKPEINSKWILPFFAFNPFMIWASVEIRVYALAILLSSLLLFNFYCGYLSDNPSRRNRIFYIILSIVSLYTQYYLGFLLVTNAVVLITFRKWKYSKQYIIDMIFPLLSILFLLPYILNQFNSQIIWMTSTINKVTYLSFFQRMTFIINRLEYYIIPENLSFMTNNKLLLLLFILFIALTWKYIPKMFSFFLSKKSFMFIIVILLSATFFFLVNFVDGPENLRPRHTACLFVPLIFSLFLLISFKNNKKILIVWTSIFIIIYSLDLHKVYSPMKKNNDPKGIAEYLMKYETKNQPIYVEYKYLSSLIKYYYKDSNNIFFLFEYNSITNPDSLHIFYDSLLNKWSTNNSIWYVSDFNDNDNYLRKEIDEKFIKLKEEMFFDHKIVYLLRQKTK